MAKVMVTESYLEDIADAIRAKKGVATTYKPGQMASAISSIAGDPVLQSKTYTVSGAGTNTITADSGYDGLLSVNVSVYSADISASFSNNFITENNVRKWRVSPHAYAEGAGWVDEGGISGLNTDFNVVPINTTITPTESSQTIGGDQYMMEGVVTVNAIPSNYIGSGITQRSSSDLTVSGATVTVPSGYYSAQASKTIATGVQNGASNSISKTTTNWTATISFPNATAGYYSTIEGGTVTLPLEDKIATPSEIQQIITPGGNARYLNSVTIEAISSTYVGSGITSRSSTDLTISGATITAPAGYYAEAASKSVSTMTLPTSAAASATSGYISKATIGRSTAAQYINIPPGYNSAGAYYVISAVANGSATAPASISGTAASISTGTNTITLTKTVSVTPTVSAGYVSSGTAGNSSVSLTASVTVNPTPTASGATVTIPAGYYSSQTTKSVTSGSATGPSSLSGSSATVSTGTNTLTLTKTGVTTTPTVSAGYVSSATASTATVTLTASVTTKAAATITPTTTNQTIASGTYLTGTQTIAGDADLVGSNIISTANIFGVQGTVVLQTVYTGSSAPGSSTGSNGDIYIQS